LKEKAATMYPPTNTKSFLVCGSKAVCLSAIVCCAFLSASIRATSATIDHNQANGFTQKAKPWITRRFLQHKNYYDVEIKYPYFTETNPHFHALNLKIKQLVLQKAHRSHNDLEVFAPGGPRGFYKENFAVKLLTPKLVSLRFDIAQYTPGAVTSSTWVESSNYSLSPLCELSLQDLFRKEVDYNLVLPVLCLPTLVASNDNLDWVMHKAEQKFYNFNLTEKELELYFQHNTPIETESIKIPLSSIKELISPICSVSSLLRGESFNEPDTEALRMVTLKQQLARIAIASYTEIIEEDPNNGFAYYKRGTWYLVLKRPTVASSDFMIAKKLGYAVPVELLDQTTSSSNVVE
jgi:hypothetical protein